MWTTSAGILGRVDALTPLTDDPARSAVLCDVDGVLAPIVGRAEDAHVREETADQRHAGHVPGLEGLAQEAEAAGFATHGGRKVLEVRPPVPIDKGQAVRTLVTGAGARFAMYAGDDATDLDAFDALEELVGEGALDQALEVGVSSDEGPAAIVERADLVVDGVEGFGRVLARLAAT